MQLLLSLALRRKRDVVRARQRARQIAALLRFEPEEQTCVAAGALAVAAQALRSAGPCRLLFQLEVGTLHIFAHVEQRSQHASERQVQEMQPAAQAPLLRLAKPLPACPSALSPEDIAWVLKQLKMRVGLDVFEEIQRQNQETLALLHALHVARGHARQPQLAEQANPSAA